MCPVPASVGQHGQPTEVLAGSIERVTFHNPANVFCVLRIKARGHRDLVTVVGHAAEISAGEWVTVSGTWVIDWQHGLQFRASFLRSSAPTAARAVRIFKTYGKDAMQVMAENPYRLARDIHGIGFRTADAIAGRLGIAPEAMIRLRASLHHALLEASGNGHCGLPTPELLQAAADLPAVPGGERGAIDPAVAIAWVEQRLSLELAASQKEAVRLALASRVLVITGGPGLGKTTLINAILQILAARRLRLQLCAPTGRAARRMAEATGLEAKTIHRLLEFDPAVYGFRRGADLPLDCDLLVGGG